MIRRNTSSPARRSRCAGRPLLDPVIVELIVRMARESRPWSRRRIASELAKLGHVVSKDTVARYMPRRRPKPRRPSQTWGTFVRNHLTGTLAIDFLTVPTATFGVLYVFFVLSLERRRVLHKAPEPSVTSGATGHFVSESLPRRAC
jgi:hypothetical protein